MSWQAAKMTVLDMLHLPLDAASSNGPYVYLIRGLVPPCTVNHAGTDKFIKTTFGYVDLHKWIAKRKQTPSVGTVRPDEFEVSEEDALKLAALDVMAMIAKVHAGEAVYMWVWSEVPLDEEVDP